MTATAGFRPDVQGLRALAVGAVVLDHLCGWPHSGFIGVDIFFVISGFLITGLLLREHDRDGRISFRGFYVRRVKRIIPAALLTLWATLVAAYVLVPHSRFREIFVDAAWSGAFAGNWRFVQQATDYFQQGGLTSPLQHFWSLGVEEQFYLVWPWLMLGLLGLVARSVGAEQRRRVGRRVLLTTITAAAVGSFVYGLHATRTDPGPAYFSTFTRVWELAVGALIAIVCARSPRPSTAATMLAWGSLGLAVVSLFVVPDTGFPVPWAALPVLAAGGVLAFGGASKIPLRPLTNPVSRYLGDISYSLYLWHFPVVVLLPTLLTNGSTGYYLVAVPLMLGLAAASYHLVEDPIRRSAWLTGGAPGATRRTLVTVVTAVAGVGVLAGMAANSSVPPINSLRSEAARAGCFGAAASAPDATCTPRTDVALQPPVALAGKDSEGSYACWMAENQPFRSCTYGSQKPGALRVAIVGDSHAANTFGGLRTRLSTLNWKVDTYLGFGCLWQLGGSSSCNALPQIQQALAAGGYDLVLTTSARQFQPGEATIGQVRAAWQPVLARGARVVVIGDNPLVPAATLECLQRVTSEPRGCSTPRSEALARPDYQVQAAQDLPGATAVDLTSFFCNALTCPAVIGNVVVYRDTYGHVTQTWSRTFAPYLARAITEALASGRR